MGFSKTSYKILICFFMANTAMAAEAPLKPLNINAKYTIAFNGITIGRIRFVAQEDAKSYSITLDTKTHGIGSIFSNEKRIAKAEGRRTADGQYLPDRYDSRPQDDDTTDRHTTLIYDATGKIKTRERVPDDDPSWRPVVTSEEINKATDSTTAGLVLRQRLYQAIAKGQTEATVRTYDGARLADFRFSVIKPEARVQVMGNYQPAINTLVTRQPINGYTPKELKKFKAGDPEMHLYFSDDEQFLPLHVSIDTSFGQLSATLAELK